MNLSVLDLSTVEMPISATFLRQISKARSECATFRATFRLANPQAFRALTCKCWTCANLPNPRRFSTPLTSIITKGQ